MAVCMEDVIENALIEQNEEVVVLESIYGDNFHLMKHEDGAEKNNKRIEFNLSLNVHHPHKNILVEAVIPVVVPEPLPSNSSCSDSDENENVDGENGEIAVESKSGNDVEEFEEVSLTESGVSRGNNKESSGAQRKKPGLSRLLSTRHWHIQSEVSSLTPIHLFCKFHPLYPTDLELCPEFNIYCHWLSECQIQELSKVLEELWQNNSNAPVVFTWAEWLENSSWEFLGLSSHIVLKEGFKENLSSQEPDSYEFNINNSALELALLNIFEHDVDIKRQEFFKVQHTCKICCEDQEGQEFCFLDECHHYCCLKCLKMHCEMHINSGTVTRLMCPTHDCTETIPPRVLQKILEEETYKRWERLLLSRTLDMMRDVYYCPRCNSVVVADEEESSRLARCASCFYSFCTECQGPWHARQSCEGEEEDEEKGKKPKKKRKKKKKKRKNLEGSEEEEEEEDEEYEYEEEDVKAQRKLKSQRMSSARFIATMKTKGMYRNCPKCKMVIEKNSGCNFMTCSHCHGTFCWVCGKAITSYVHFTSSPNCTAFANVEQVVIPPPKPSEGDLLLAQFKKKNPGKAVRLKKCPTCSQNNIKALNNNHLNCWSCKMHYCYQCGKKIEGGYKHYISPSLCTQHSDD